MSLGQLDHKTFPIILLKTLIRELIMGAFSGIIVVFIPILLIENKLQVSKSSLLNNHQAALATCDKA